jgi:hypothetical protein
MKTRARPRRRITRAVAVAIAAVAGVVGTAADVGAGPFTGGIVVQRMGDGAAPLTATGTPVFLEEYSLSNGSLTNTVPFPVTDPDDAGPQRRFVDVGNSTATGFLNRSVDGRYLVSVGYDAAAGATVPGDPAVVNRIIARVDALGVMNTATGYSEGANNHSVRSAASVDGSTFYVTTANAATGTRYIDTVGAIDTSSQIVLTGGQRSIGIHGGRLFVATAAAGILSLKDQATGGLPTSATNTSDTLETTNGTSTNILQFTLLDRDPNVGYDGTGLDTLYVADAAAISTTANPTGAADTSGGLKKYTYDSASGNFVLNVTFNAGLSATSTDPLFGGLRGLAFAGVDESGNPILYATTAGPLTGNALVRLVDSGPSSAFTLVANSPANTVFRGVAPAPVPEPGGAVALAAGALGLIARRRRTPSDIVAPR